MKVAVCYVYPLIQSTRYFPLAKRFADTWKKYPGYNLHVVTNGSAPRPADLAPFQGIECRVLQHNNLGWDVGAFQAVADSVRCDLLVCLGAPVYFHRQGWLDRMVEAYVQNGPALYGCWGYHYPRPHIRTTAFWLPPQLLQAYPEQVLSTKVSRYAFEHGERSLTKMALESGLGALMVTPDGVYPIEQWKEHVPGLQDSLVWDQHTHP